MLPQCLLPDGTQQAGAEIAAQRMVLQHLLPVLEPFPEPCSRANAEPGKLSQLINIYITVVYKGSSRD